MHLPSALLLLALPATASAPRAQAFAEDPRIRVETWFTGLTRPVSLTFVGEDELLVMQNVDGQVLRIRDGLAQNVALDLTVSIQGGRGLVADPGVETNGYVYLYYGASSVADGAAWEETRVERYTFDGTNLTSPFGPLFTVPYDPAQPNADSYNSGVLRFGPDGMLYGQVGDKGRGRLSDGRIEENTATSGSSLAGGIFRITTTGAIPADNPIVAEPDPGVHPWIVYGFRNSLGMDFDPVGGDLWFSDNSVGDYDEVNRASFGMNSGWLKVFGPDARDAVYPLNGNTPFDASDLVYLPGAFYRDPEFSYKQANGVTAVVFLSSRRFPEDLWDDLLVGDVNFGQLYHYELASDRASLVLAGAVADRVADTAAERDAARWAGGLGTITDAVVGPDGYLYVVSWDLGTVFRLRPVVDLHEPTGFSVPGGALVSGGLDELLASDGARLVVGAGARPSWFEKRILETSCRLTGTTPTRLDVRVDARASGASGVQTVEIYHVPTSAWQVLDRRPASRAGLTVLVEDVAQPEDYVDAGGEVRVRVRQRAPRHGLAPLTGTPPSSSWTMEVDRVQVLATHP